MPRRATPRNRRPLDELPLFVTDAELGEALLGSARVSEWCGIAPLLESRGLPKLDPFMGGRYRPAVARFFERQYGDDAPAPVAARPHDSGEDLSVWKTKRKPRA